MNGLQELLVLLLVLPLLMQCAIIADPKRSRTNPTRKRMPTCVMHCDVLQKLNSVVALLAASRAGQFPLLTLMELPNVLVNVTELLLATLTIAHLRSRVHFHVRGHRLREDHEAAKCAFHAISINSDYLVVEDVLLQEPVADWLFADFTLDQLGMAVHAFDVVAHSLLGVQDPVADVALEDLVLVGH